MLKSLCTPSPGIRPSAHVRSHPVGRGEVGRLVGAVHTGLQGRAPLGHGVGAI